VRTCKRCLQCPYIIIICLCISAFREAPSQTALVAGSPGCVGPAASSGVPIICMVFESPFLGSSAPCPKCCRGLKWASKRAAALSSDPF